MGKARFSAWSRNGKIHQSKKLHKLLWTAFFQLQNCSNIFLHFLHSICSLSELLNRNFAKNDSETLTGLPAIARLAIAPFCTQDLSGYQSPGTQGNTMMTMVCNCARSRFPEPEIEKARENLNTRLDAWKRTRG